MTTKKKIPNATKSTSEKAAKADAKATTKAPAKVGAGGDRLRKATLAEIGHRIEAARDERQDHEVPSEKEVANTANLRAAAAAKAAKRPKAAKEPKPAKAVTAKRTSALDAAAIVLAESAEPMGTKELIEQMGARGLWTSPGGKTPEATLYAAILREIGTRKDTSRFAKVERGRFVATAKSATDGKAA